MNFEWQKTLPVASTACMVSTASQAGGRYVPGVEGTGRVLGAVQAGIVGYSQVQLQADTAASAKCGRHALGAEVSLPLFDEGLILKAAVYKELSAKGGAAPQAAGSTVRATIVKVFGS